MWFAGVLHFFRQILVGRLYEHVCKQMNSPSIATLVVSLKADALHEACRDANSRSGWAICVDPTPAINTNGPSLALRCGGLRLGATKWG